MQKHIIFDLDGTLIDSKPQIIDTYKLVFKQLIPTLHLDYNSINFGDTLQNVLKKVLNNDTALVKKGQELFASIYDNSDYIKTLLYPNVVETLEYLKTKNYNLYIATNKRQTPTINILKAKNILHLFKDVVAHNIYPNKILSKQEMVAEILIKYNIKNAFIIGDSIEDIDTGIANRIHTIAALYGYGKNEDLLKKNPIFTIQQIKELKKIL